MSTETPLHESILAKVKDALYTAEKALKIPTVQAEVEAAAVKLKKLCRSLEKSKGVVLGIEALIARLEEAAQRCAMVVEAMVKEDEHALTPLVSSARKESAALLSLAKQFVQSSEAHVKSWWNGLGK